MGTNYYWHFDPDREIERDRLHIGKSSAGWCFSLHVIPEIKIRSLEDWVRLWDRGGGRIVDEYGGEHTRDEMLRKITRRSWATFGKPILSNPTLRGGRERTGWLHRNDAVEGPQGLARHAIGRYCLGHGNGTWDLIPGEFS